jgi:hypothetical protein
LFGSGFQVDLPYVVGAFPLVYPVAGVPESSATTFIGPGRTAAIVNLGPADRQLSSRTDVPTRPPI